MWCYSKFSFVMDRLDLARIFSVIKDDLTPSLTEALLSMLTIEDYAPKVKKAQRNLVDREALMIRKESNKQEAKELAQSIDNSNDSPDRIEPELNQLKAKRAELEKELEKVKTAIEEHESNLARIPDTIKQKRQEMSMLFDC
jgi:predicted  nucleic acid-binding Zn-ribbon protein